MASIKLTGLSDEEVNSLLETFRKSNEDIYSEKDLEISLVEILLNREVSIHYDTINNEENIIRF